MNLKEALKKLNNLRTKKEEAYKHNVQDALSYASSTTYQSGLAWGTVAVPHSYRNPYSGSITAFTPGSYIYATTSPAALITPSVKLYLIATKESVEDGNPKYFSVCLLGQDGGFYDVETGECIDLQMNNFSATEMSLATIAKRIRESSTGG